MHQPCPPVPQLKLPVGVCLWVRYTKIMMRIGKSLALAASTLAFCYGARALNADTPGGPYHSIVERNVFDVHPAPLTPPTPVAPPGPPPPSIRLQGITDILGRRQVLFKVQLPPKPGTPAKDESFILTVGERQGEIEVLAIDPKAGTVRMRNYGVETNLSLEMNSDKLVNVAPVAAPTPPPGAPMTAPGTLAPPPPGLPNQPPGLPAGKFPRTLRLPGSTGAQNNPGQSSAVNYGGYGNYGGNPNQQHVEMTPDQQIINMAAQKLQARQSNDPKVRAIDAIMPMPAEIQKEFDPPPTPGEQAQ